MGITFFTVLMIIYFVSASLVEYYRDCKNQKRSELRMHECIKVKRSEMAQELKRMNY